MQNGFIIQLKILYGNENFFSLGIVAFLTIFTSCSNDIDESLDSPKSSATSPLESLSNVEIVITDKGEVITLTDTTVYHVNIEDTHDENFITNDWSMTTRATTDSYPKKITVKGYDKKNQNGSYSKIVFGDNAAKYGLVKGTIYLVCFYNITKELALEKDENIRPRDYMNNLDDTAMGWSSVTYSATKKFVKGFDASANSVNGFVTATTMLRYVNCDLAGHSYNRFIPYDPSDLVWQYVVSYSPGWD